MTTPAIATALRRFSFWPGWTFMLFEHPNYEGPWVRIRADVPDAYHPAETTELGIDSALPPIPDEAYLAQWLTWRCVNIAVHEALEWSRWDGVPVIDPHAEIDYADRQIRGDQRDESEPTSAGPHPAV